jgi:hypothetical protein
MRVNQLGKRFFIKEMKVSDGEIRIKTGICYQVYLKDTSIMFYTIEG